MSLHSIFFALGGATLSLWMEFWFRKKNDEKRIGMICSAIFTFTKSACGELSGSLNPGSENVGYYAWYVNNGGTMHNEAVLVFIEFEKQIPSPEVFANAAIDEGEWREIASTERFMFVDGKGWPNEKIVLQAFDSKALGMDRQFRVAGLA